MNKNQHSNSFFWVVHSLFSLTALLIHSFTETDYLETYAESPGDIYGASSLDKAMKNVFIQTRKFLMAQYGLTEGEATTIITQGVDFAVTRVVVAIGACTL